MLFRGITYRGVLGSVQITVNAGEVPTHNVTYVPIDSHLDVTVSGLPSDQNRVRVTGPNFNSGLFGESKTFTGLTPGAYTVTAQAFTVAPGKPGCKTFSPNATTQQRLLTAGQTGSVEITYTSEACEL